MHVREEIINLDERAKISISKMKIKDNFKNFTRLEHLKTNYFFFNWVHKKNERFLTK